MKYSLKPYALSFGAAALLALAGCETMNDAAIVEEPAFAEVPISRARVVAELYEAQRLGLLTVGEGDVPEMTAEQSRLIAAAGAKADASEKVAGR